MTDYCEATGKIGYGTKAEAAHALARITARRADKGANLKPYICPDCGMAHLGRQATAQRGAPRMARRVRPARDTLALMGGGS